MPEDEEKVGSEAESTAAAEAAAGDKGDESATDFLKKSVAEIQAKADAEEPPPGEEAVTSEGEGKTLEGEGKAGEETEEIDESEMLKRSGFTQKSLDDLKDDLNRANDRSQFWNWAETNIDGFREFVFQQLMASKGLAPKGKAASITDLAGKPAESQVAGESALLEKYSQEQLDEFKEIARGIGFVHRSEIEAGKQADSEKKAQDTATKTFEDFGKSQTVKDQLKAMDLDWEKDAKAPVVKILLEGFGISDFGRVNSENIARAYNAFVMERMGGIEQMLANVKSEALKTHKKKLELGKTIPEIGVRGPTAPTDFDAWLNDPKRTADDLKKRMQELAGRGK